MISKQNNSYIIQNTNKKCNINWSIFDKIYCVHYLPYSERVNQITCQLSRLGILSNKNFSFFNTVPNKYYNSILSQFGDKINVSYDKKCDSAAINLNTEYKVDISLVNTTNINYTINSYNLLMDAYYNNYNNILIIEDDCQFLNNMSYIKSCIDNYPDNYDIVNFEPWKYQDNNTKVYSYSVVPINNYFNSIQGNFILFDTGMISFSRRGIEHILNNQDIILRPFDGYTHTRIYLSNNDHLNTNVKFAYSVKKLCIQADYAVKQEQTNIIDLKYQKYELANYISYKQQRQYIFSIITPVYNGEQYLHKYFQNVLSQINLYDIEIILIDDCSTDQTSTIIKQYQEKYKNIKLITNLNRLYPGISRNRGIAMSTALYIMFIDVDDMIPTPTTLQIIKNIIYKTNSLPVYGGGVKFITQQNTISNDTFYGDNVKFTNQMLSFDKFQYDWYFQRFIIKRSFLIQTNCRFPDLYRAEDPLFIINVLHLSKSFYAMDLPIYVYRQSNNYLNETNFAFNQQLISFNKIVSLCINNSYIVLLDRIKNHINRIINLIVSRNDNSNQKLLNKYYKLVESINNYKQIYK